MTLISIVGDVGSGKTLLATYLAKNDTRPVYSNYKIKIPNWRNLLPETLQEIHFPALVILDEAYIWIESRLRRDINQYSSYILFQSRKRGIDFIITEQLVSSVDCRFRSMTNYLIECENIEDIGFRYKIFKMSRYHTYKPKTVVMPYSLAEKIYPLYDTLELINPIDEGMMFKIRKDKTPLISEIDEIVDNLLENTPPEAYTKGIIADWCLRNNYHKTYIDLIFNAIQARKIAQKSYSKNNISNKKYKHKNKKPSNRHK